MTLLQLTSFMVPVWSLAAKGGIAHQAVMNLCRKSTNGISVPYFMIGMISYGWFGFYGMLIHSVPVIVAQLPGAILHAIVLGQVLYYQERIPASDEDWMLEIEEILR